MPHPIMHPMATIQSVEDRTASIRASEYLAGQITDAIVEAAHSGLTVHQIAMALIKKASEVMG